MGASVGLKSAGDKTWVVWRKRGGPVGAGRQVGGAYMDVVTIQLALALVAERYPLTCNEQPASGNVLTRTRHDTVMMMMMTMMMIIHTHTRAHARTHALSLSLIYPAV